MRLSRGILRLAARVRPAVPPGLLDATVAAASVVAPVPIVAVPALTRVLVVAPHPDDETIGCGGTIARLTAAGTQADVVVCTDGEATIGSPASPAETARRRRDEAVAACALLGARPPTFLGLPDGHLPAHAHAVADALDDRLRALRPQAVLVPWALERHADHRAIVAALAATPRHPDVDVWCYEVHTPLHPSHLVPLDDDAVARKREALLAHATAGLAFPLEATLALNRWRSITVGADTGHAEAFHVTTWDALPGLAALAERSWARPAAAPSQTAPSGISPADAAERRAATPARVPAIAPATASHRT